MKHIRSLTVAAALGTVATVLISAPGASAATDSTAPVIRSLTATPAPADVTTGSKQVTLTARITDDVSGTEVAWAGAQFVRAASSPAAAVPLSSLDATFTRVAGTALDGTYRAVLTLPAGLNGSWNLTVSARDTALNTIERSPQALAAAGLTSSVASRTTTAPPTPAKVTGRTQADVVWLRGVVLTGYVEWTLPTTGGRPVTTVVDSASAACGTLGYTATTYLRFDGRLAAPCTVKFRLVNGAGYSAPASVTFF